MGEFMRAVGTIAVMVLVILAAGYVTRYVAQRAGRSMARTRYMKVMDRLALAKDKTVVILRVGETDYLVGISGQNITLLDTLEPLPEPPEADGRGGGPGGPVTDRLRTLLERPGGPGRKFSDFLSGKWPPRDENGPAGHDGE